MFRPAPGRCSAPRASIRRFCSRSGPRPPPIGSRPTRGGSGPGPRSSQSSTALLISALQAANCGCRWSGRSRTALDRWPFDCGNQFAYMSTSVHAAAADSTYSATFASCNGAEVRVSATNQAVVPETVQQYIDEVPAWRDGTPAAADAMTSMQKRIWLLASAGKFFEGMIIFMVGVALPLINAEFDLTAAQTGFITAAPLLGIMIGATALGGLSVRW